MMTEPLMLVLLNFVWWSGQADKLSESLYLRLHEFFHPHNEYLRHLVARWRTSSGLFDWGPDFAADQKIIQ
eukprot:m.109882 g.109882  ORF g.109882 m.109882 type:complete len:71 (-) comp51788_c0_seq4:128-340(-)